MAKIYTIPTADSIPFDNSGTGYTAQTIQDAIVEVGDKAGFSYKRIAASKTILIPEDQQMCIRQHIKIEGSLIIDGELVIL